MKALILVPSLLVISFSQSSVAFDIQSSSASDTDSFNCFAHCLKKANVTTSDKNQLEVITKHEFVSADNIDSKVAYQVMHGKCKAIKGDLLLSKVEALTASEIHEDLGAEYPATAKIIVRKQAATLAGSCSHKFISRSGYI